VTCFRTEFVRRESTPDTIPPTHAPRNWANDRVLVCSNAPERIPQLQGATAFELWGTIVWDNGPPDHKIVPDTSTATNTLYRCLLPVSVGTKKVRLFLWHINETAAQTLHFSVLAGLNGPIPR